MPCWGSCLAGHLAGCLGGKESGSRVQGRVEHIQQKYHKLTLFPGLHHLEWGSLNKKRLNFINNLDMELAFFVPTDRNETTDHFIVVDVQEVISGIICMCDNVMYLYISKYITNTSLTTVFKLFRNTNCNCNPKHYTYDANPCHISRICGYKTLPFYIFHKEKHS